MANRFIIKRNASLGVVPTAGTGATQLLAGELALNTSDEKLYFVNASGVVVSFLSTNKTPASGAAVNIGARSFLMMGG